MTAPDPPPLDEIAAAAGAPMDAPDLRGDPAEDGGEALDVIELGDNCPVQPLGFLGQKNFFLDWKGQLIPLGTEFRKGEVMQLFGLKMAWAEKRWPEWGKVRDKQTGEEKLAIVGFNQKHVQKGLILACGKAGLFDPKGKVRGRGAHRGEDGEIVMHCGDQVLVGGRRGTRGRPLRSQWMRSGLVGGFVYPTAPALPHPAEEPASDAIAAQILVLLDSWRWKRKTRVSIPGVPASHHKGTIALDAYLLFCWLATAQIGGATRHRPHLWITGPTGTGKTTLQDVLRQLMDEWGISTEDATEAGVRQLLDQDTLAVMFDEIEPDEGNADVHMKIVKLARLAYSGGSGLRGGQDHVSKQFVARSCFLFSSIHHHELPAQDRNRICVLNLDKFPPKTKQLTIPAMLKEWGAQLRRRLVEQWGRYEPTIAAFVTEMLAQGYSGREQNTYGTLLACGDLLLHDSAPDRLSLADGADRCAALAKALAAVLDSVRAESVDTTERAVRFLGSTRLPSRGSTEQESVSRWIEKRVIGIVNEGAGSVHGPAQQKLLTHGLRIVHLLPDHDKGNGQGGLIEGQDPSRAMFVAIANKTNRGMLEIFEPSMFRKGVWTQSLALVPGAIVNKKSRFGGNPEGCVLVPIEEMIDVDAARLEAEQLRMAREAEGP